MRSVRIATCTSGEPVSPDFKAYSFTSACLRSTVIDIGLPFRLEKSAASLTMGGAGAAEPGCRPGRSRLTRGEKPPRARPYTGIARRRQSFVQARARRGDSALIAVFQSPRFTLQAERDTRAARQFDRRGA